MREGGKFKKMKRKKKLYEGGGIGNIEKKKK